jgi:hypothetical protein
MMMLDSALIRTPAGRWVQRLYYVPAKRRAVIQGLIGLYLVIASAYGIVKIKPMVLGIHQQTVWVSPVVVHEPFRTVGGPVGYTTASGARLTLAKAIDFRG